MREFIVLVTILDGANFDALMARRAFVDYTLARPWAEKRRDELRAKRREEGETDEIFVTAIEAQFTEIEYVDHFSDEEN